MGEHTSVMGESRTVEERPFMAAIVELNVF